MLQESVRLAGKRLRNEQENTGPLEAHYSTETGAEPGSAETFPSFDALRPVVVRMVGIVTAGGLMLRRLFG